LTSPVPQPACQYPVAIVDDDEALRDALSGLLESSGIASVAFSSAEEFLERSAGMKIGCLLLDFQLPGMNGLELQHRLRHLSTPPPVIFFTSYDRPDLRESALRAGARCYLTKPVDSNRLLNAVCECLGIKAQGC